MEVFTQLAVVLGLGAGLGLVAKLLRQPVLLGYIAAGAVIAALGWPVGLGEGGLVPLLGQLGVTLLLFLVGLELPIEQLRHMGKVALATGLGQIVFTAAVGYPILLALGFNPVAGLYLAVALAFSSTIIIVKLLSEKKDLQSLYGKVVVGFLLVQDFVAIGMLIILSGLGSGGTIDWFNLILVVVKGAALVSLALFLSGKILPRIFDWLGESTEMLFVAAIAWCVAVATIVASPVIGFGLEIGGFLAGLALSGAAQHLQIGARIRPLRDFFLTLFFVSLGASVQVGDVTALWLPALVLSVFVLVGNPLIVMVIMGLLGFKKRVSFLASVTVAQISEFSLIVVAAAARVGHVGRLELAITALVGAITMVASTYMILHASFLYRLLAGFLGVFERKKPGQSELEVSPPPADHIVLFGHNRIGGRLYPALKRLGLPVVVVDFDPHTVDKLSQQHDGVIYGDLADFDLYEQLGLQKAKLVVSTVSNVEDNRQLLHFLRESKRRPIAVVTASDQRESDQLYSAGADYVLIPHAVGGEYLAHIFRQHGIDKTAMRRLHA